MNRTKLHPPLLLLFLTLLLAACQPDTEKDQPPDTETNFAALSEVPPRTTDDLLSFSSKVDNAYYLVNPGSQEGYLYAELKAGKYQPAESERTPLNLSVVLDRSGSMAGAKLRYVKEAASFLVDNLSPEDYLSVVTYESNVKTEWPSKSVKEKALIKRKIEAIEDEGSTNLSGGMLEGYSQVKSTYQNGFVNRVMLLSDGLANRGITEPTKLQEIATKQNRENSITLSTFGVGADFNEDLMQNLAEYGIGNYYFIDSPDKIPAIFQQELKGLLSVVAQNCKLELTFPDAIEPEYVYGYEHTKNGNKITVNFMDIFSEDTKAILIRFKIKGGNHGPLMINSKIVYDDATDQYTRKSLTSEQVIDPTTESSVYNGAFSEFVQQQITLFKSNETLEQAMKEVDNRNFEKARKLVDENEKYLKDRKSQWKTTPEIEQQDSINRSYKTKIKNAENMSTSEMKMMQKSSKNYNYQLKKKKR